MPIPMMTLPFLLVARALATATAASGTVSVAESADQDDIVNIAECQNSRQDNLTMSWAFTSSSSGPYTILASDETGCPQSSTSSGTITATTVTLTSGVTSTSYTDLYTVSQRVAAVFGAGCPTTASVLFICVFDSTMNTILTGSIALDFAAPPAPVANEPEPGDGALNVSWSQGTGSADAGTGSTSSYNVYCDVHPATSPITKKCGSVSGQGTTSTRIQGLTIGTEYDVEVTAASEGGNESDHSNTVSGTPVLVNDFWRLYKTAEGNESGGCALGGGGLLALLGLLPLALRRERDRS